MATKTAKRPSNTSKALTKSQAKKELEALLAKMLAEGEADVQEALAKHGLMVAAKGPTTKPLSRSATKEAWLARTDLSDQEKEAFDSLPALIGTGVNLDTDDQLLTQEEVDGLMKEVMPERLAEDVLEGRLKRIKRTIFNHLNKKLGSETKPGIVPSPKHGMKFTREIKEFGPEVDEERMQQTLERKKWNAISSPTRVFDPQKYAEAVDKGTITEEEVAPFITPGRVDCSFHVRPLKKGDELG